MIRYHREYLARARIGRDRTGLPTRLSVVDTLSWVVAAGSPASDAAAATVAGAAVTPATTTDAAEA